MKAERVSRTVATAPTSTSLRAGPTDRWFYLAVALVSIMTVLAGFGPAIIETSGRNAPITLLAEAHGIASFTWLLIFLSQATLIATQRTALHRRLGMASAVVAFALVVTGYETTVAMARRGFDLSGDLGFKSHTLSIGPLSNLVTFSILVAAGYWYRRQSQIHKRLMVLAILGGLMPAPLAHLIGHSPFPHQMQAVSLLVLILVFLFASAAYDRFSLGRFNRVSLWGAIVIFVWDVVVILVGHSAAWHQFGNWLVR